MPLTGETVFVLRENEKFVVNGLKFNGSKV
jgi:hypothetical protein